MGRNKKKLQQGFRHLGLVFDDEQGVLERLYFFFCELKKWNEKINLVSREADDSELLEKHFLDSLLVSRCLDLPPGGFFEQHGDFLLDIGTGAGFPGLVLKAAIPALPVTLIEPRQKRCFFLKHIVRSLQLPSIEVLNIRLEANVPHPYLTGRQFSHVTSRALTDAESFIDLSAHYLKEDGSIILMKGPDETGDKQEKLGDALRERQFRIIKGEHYQLPFSESGRTLLVIGKDR